MRRPRRRQVPLGLSRPLRSRSHPSLSASSPTRTIHPYGRRRASSAQYRQRPWRPHSQHRLRVWLHRRHRRSRSLLAVRPDVCLASHRRLPSVSAGCPKLYLEVHRRMSPSSHHRTVCQITLLRHRVPPRLGETDRPVDLRLRHHSVPRLCRTPLTHLSARLA